MHFGEYELSPSLISTHSDYHALLRLAFASAPGLKPLTLPEKVTRRFIMQKARRHTLMCSDRL